MKKLFLLYLITTCFVAAPATAQIRLEKRLPMGDAPLLEPATARLNFPGGYLDYLASSTPDLPEKLAESRFGLSFSRPPQTNGGWDLWRFLRVWVRSENGLTSYEVIERHLLSSVEVLEDGTRRVFEFVWPLEEGRLVITFIQSAAQEEWLLMRLSLEGEGLSIQRVMLSAFPGNTTGPKERERWIAVGDQEYRLTQQPRDLGAPESGLVLFNRMAQGDTGCLLVAKPEGISRVLVSGSYNTAVSYELESGINEFQAALGGYVERSTEEIVRVFAMEGARNILQTLQSTDWKSRPDYNAHQRLFSELEALLKDVGTADEAKEFSTLEESYRLAKQQNNVATVLESTRRAKDLCTQLVHRALAQWK